MKVLLVVAALVLGAQAGNLVEELGKLNVTTLIDLATTAGLADTLTTGGPFTLLAPSDAAFAKLPAATLTSLKADKAALADLLKYHLIQGDIFSWDVANGDRFTSLNGRSIKVTTSGTSTMFNGAKVLVHDNVASNGVIYLIDTVLKVPEPSIFQAIANRPELSTLVEAITRSHLDRTLNSTTGYPYTMFAPTNAAFAKLTTDQLNHILESRYLLLELVDYHLHTGQLHKGSFTHNGRLATRYSGHYISVTIEEGGEPVLNHVARLSEADIEAENGIVHVIDHLLLPSTLASVIG